MFMFIARLDQLRKKRGRPTEKERKERRRLEVFLGEDEEDDENDEIEDTSFSGDDISVEKKQRKRANMGSIAGNSKSKKSITIHQRATFRRKLRQIKRLIDLLLMES